MSTSSSGYWPMAENGISTSSLGDKDNVFYERVTTYNPVSKVMQVLDPGSPKPLSPRAGSPYQTVMWSTEQPQQYIQEIQAPYSPTPYTQSSTIRKYIVQNPEQEIHAPYSPTPHTQSSTIRKYIVQNPEQEIQAPYSPTPHTQSSTIRKYIVQNPEQEMQGPFQQGTLRRYIVQNPDQQTPFLKGVNFVPGNNVIYEKTIRRIDGPSTDQTHIIRGMNSVSVDNAVHEQNNQRKVSVQSSDSAFVFDQHTQGKTSFHSSDQQQKTQQDFGTDKMDSRYFGELLAELSRKHNDLYSCLLQHVEKIGGRKPSDSTEYKTEDIESVIPKGASELTKQQIRYLLQMRQTSDKSMRLVLSTFSSLREDLGHLQSDLNKLETDKSILERDLTFKESQVKEYEALLASVRENNRQQQQALKDSALRIRTLEEQILRLNNSDADKEYRIKELQYSKRALEQEGNNLRVQISQTCSSPLIQTKTDEISKHYMEMLGSLQEEKDKEIRNLRTQISTFQHDVTSKEGSSRDLQIRLIELTSALQKNESLIKKQQEELFRLRQERESKSGVVITKKYRNRYPILGLLSDYNATAPIKDSQTIVIERTGEIWKQEYFPTP